MASITNWIIFMKTIHHMWKKEIILQIQDVYTANAFKTNAGLFIGAGSETGDQVYLYDLSNRKERRVNNCPGGMMSFIPVPGNADLFVTIMGLFPPFIGKDTGLYLHQSKGKEWETIKVLELPFAHRCEILTRGGKNYLFAATVSKFKEEPKDWSRPGEIHLVELGDDLRIPWKSRIIDCSITRNHGMLKRTIDGKETILVSGQEGIFYLEWSEDKGWTLQPLFGKEVSEMTLIDLDGDGNDELVTIEPFHGQAVNIYKQIKGKWEIQFSDSLSFGHGLSSGMMNGEPIVIVGNRSNSLSLDSFHIRALSTGRVERKTIEAGVGPTQTQIFSDGATDYILSANQKKNEVALYSVSA